MIMNRSGFPKSLVEGLHARFGMDYAENKKEYTEAFDIQTSKKAYEEDVLEVGFGAVPKKFEGEGVVYDSGAESYTVRYEMNTYSMAFAITEEMMEDDLYGKKGKDYSSALARSLRHTEEVESASILANGFSTSYPGGDGAALLSNSHTMWNGASGSNTLTTQADLAEASLEELIVKSHMLVDDRGMNIACMAVKLIVPPGLAPVAYRLTMADLRPGTPDNDPNWVKGDGQLPGGYTVLHKLVDPKAWFLKTDCPRGLQFFDRKSATTNMEGDFSTGNMRFRIRRRFVPGFTNWRGILGSSGTGT